MNLVSRYLPFTRWFRRTWSLSGPLAGYRMVASPDAYGLYVANRYEPRVCRAVEQIVQPGWTCVDAGAHIGYMTLLLARLVGERGRVIAFEAWPENARLIERNSELNGLSSRVRVEAQAVAGEARDRVSLFPGRNQSSCEWSVMEGMWPRGGTAVDVPAISLDAYFPPSAPLDFVKMDIEGGEALAMVGMRRILRTVKPTILLEFHREAGWPAIEELAAAGYRLFDLDGASFDASIGPELVPYQLIARPADVAP